MPNWCNNFMTFWSDGTPEGNLCLKDLHDKIVQTSELMRKIAPHKNDFWEVYLARYGYNVDIDCYQRGYICYVTDIEDGGQSFSIECEDAWSANIKFWLALTQYFYQNHITFTFQAMEPGMGIYETNDPGMLPRYSLHIYASNIDEVLKYDKLWNWNNPLFPRIDSDMVNINNQGWYKHFVGYDKDMGAIFKDVYALSAPSFYFSVDGDDDEVMEELRDLRTFPASATIDDIAAADDNTININEWQFVDTDQMVAGEIAAKIICNSITGGSVIDKSTGELNYGLVTPIYDNFVTFGGEKDEQTQSGGSG